MNIHRRGRREKHDRDIIGRNGSQRYLTTLASVGFARLLV